MALSGCGSVPEEMAPDGRADAQLPPGTTTYRGTLQMAPLARFGGSPYCTYTVALSQIELELNLLTSGEVKGGTSQALAVEMQLASTTPPCPAGPGGIPPNIHKFTFKSATPSGTGYLVMMNSDPANQPSSKLAFTLSPAAGAFTAAARWTRTDALAILTWDVMSDLTLTVK
jgi:hypothetical protein